MDKKEEILKLLQKGGEKPATEIYFLVGSSYYKIRNLLNELIKDGKIESVTIRNNVYYKLKTGKK